MPAVGKRICDRHTAAHAYRIRQSKAKTGRPFLSAGWLIETMEDLRLIKRHITGIADDETVIIHNDFNGASLRRMDICVLDQISNQYRCHLFIHHCPEFTVLLQRR